MSPRTSISELRSALADQRAVEPPARLNPITPEFDRYFTAALTGACLHDDTPNEGLVVRALEIAAIAVARLDHARVHGLPEVRINP